ncbi:hypothetical protein FOTG_19230 [Fusarium oxysporum f. sp. vasinfectum 25433]|uniref:Uncharacterized protein n=1 Tax=Fusarium oxysporum f. sp. vasinfectum 25433 TaxID=1089449 RepID=X0KF95_FUSOX|nr:hypothetical protein FOTG_19230 [Fusarium oxysporum f. sp. vasinfectum 25433]
MRSIKRASESFQGEVALGRLGISLILCPIFFLLSC